ncbi:hypothetical protein TcBrA4_0076100 [Trypanosoma cruzi]|nr:hypothetical protein TcBrA4_0076100 [Trypanosoma cruzi]
MIYGVKGLAEINQHQQCPVGSVVELIANTALLGKAHLEIVISIMLHFVYQVCQLHRRGTHTTICILVGCGVHTQSNLFSTIFSATLLTMEVRLMGRYDSSSSGDLPGFKSGTMVARLHSTGIVPVVQLWLMQRRRNRRPFDEICRSASL